MIHISRLRCAAGHMVFGAAYDSEDLRPEEAEAGLKATFAATFNSWCGMCGSRSISYSVEQTGYASLDEAEGAIMAEQKREMNIRRSCDLTGQSYDARHGIETPDFLALLQALRDRQ